MHSSLPRKTLFVFGFSLLLMAFAANARANDYQNLPVIKPMITCDQLAQADIRTPDGTKITINTATTRQTGKGPYCHVTGSVASNINFQGDLPVEHWTQRFLMGGISQQSSGCMPAMNGEIAVAGGAGGIGEVNNSDPAAATWGITPQQRINAAYLSDHMIGVSVKAVIKTFYGQGPKFSYMSGCSSAGMSTLRIAQRYPEDFDGYLIGAPPLYQTTHDLGFWHGWEWQANSRPDGSVILTKDKLPILHAAVIEHCAAVSGIIDGALEQPTACKFDKSWVQCPAGAADTSKCLTADEANVAEQLYLGPNDSKGHYFEPGGYALGSELQWRLSTPGKPADGEGQNPHGIHSFTMPPLSGQDTKTIMASFSFSEEWFNKTQEMWPMFNAGNTNLRKLSKLGDKILLWNGAEDTTVQPTTPLSYYEAVQKEMGVKETDSFLRFFLLPGVGHCGNGESANEVDLLTPLMAWVEMHKAPSVIVVGRPVEAVRGQGGQDAFGGQNAAGAPAGPGGPGRPAQGGPGGPGGGTPYPQPARPTIYTRPIYPFPHIAKYKGTGDPNDAANYEEVKGAANIPLPSTNESARLLGPDNQKFYKAEGDKLVVIPKP